MKVILGIFIRQELTAAMSVGSVTQLPGHSIKPTCTPDTCQKQVTELAVTILSIVMISVGQLLQCSALSPSGTEKKG